MFADTGINWLGIGSIIVFYLLILGVGMWAAAKKGGDDLDQEEEVMLAGRNIGMFVGIFTMTATWVGGGYINGTAEIVFSSGLIWCQAPLGYALSLALGGIFFAHRMRREGYVTMLDPLQDVFGGRMGGLLFLPALCGEVFWSAGILAALGATLAIIINMGIDTAVIVSALIAIFYTWVGGLYSVAYTDVVQLGCIAIGLVISIPFAWTHEAVSPITWNSQDWIGEIGEGYNGYYADYMLLLTFGGIPWQVYFQRVLSSKTAAGAELISYVAAFGCILMAVPPILIGAIAKSTDWSKTDFKALGENGTLTSEDARMILPMVLQYLCPPFIAFFGLGSVSAAVMSSADSSVLSASSMFARNVYKLIFRPNASETEILWVMRVAIFIVGAMATAMALTIKTIYGLWAMCSDLVYVILFPQLLMVVHFKEWCNTYGSLFAYIVGLFFRLAGGEKMIHLPPLIKYPYYNEESGDQLFPFRTMSMILSMISLVGVSHLTWFLFNKNHLSKEWDVFGCFTAPDFEPNELFPMDPSGMKKYTEEDEDGAAGASAAAATAAAKVTIAEKKPIRKPDPNLRQLQRQISFGSGAPLIGLGSLKKKQMSTGASIDKPDRSPVAEESETNFDVDMCPNPDENKGPKLKKMLSLESGKEGIKQMKKELKEAKAELKDHVKHLPDGHRGSLANVNERPPYRPIPKQSED